MCCEIELSNYLFQSICLNFLGANASFMSFVRAVCFSSVRDTLRYWVLISQPRHVFCSASFPSPASFLNESGSSHFRGSDCCSGRNSVWMTNRAALLARSIQWSSSTVMVMMSLMKPSIDASVAMISATKGSAFARCLADWCFSSGGSKDLCGKLRSFVYQDWSWSRSLPRFIAASLIVLNCDGAGVVPKGNIKQRKASSSTITMHVDAVFACACIRR